MLAQDLGQQEGAANRGFFLFGIARNLDDVHAVCQRARNLEAHVAGADEEDLGEIVGQFQVMIGEGVVLFGVQHFQQRRRRVAAIVGGHFVDLVQQEDRVTHADGLHGLDDAPRQRADIRPAVAANLGLIVHAAQRDAGELAAQRAGNRMAQRGFADAWRANQTEDGAFVSVGFRAVTILRAFRASCAVGAPPEIR